MPCVHMYIIHGAFVNELKKCDVILSLVKVTNDVCPANTKVSLCIPTVYIVLAGHSMDCQGPTMFSFGTLWVAQHLKLFHVNSEDPDQTMWMLSFISVFPVHTFCRFSYALVTVDVSFISQGPLKVIYFEVLDRSKSCFASCGSQK